MPIIYLKHPDHGTKVAYMEAEANADVENGWVVYNPANNVAKPAPQLSVVTAKNEEEVKAEQPEELKRRRRN
jgi:hypothetical protein